jgi:hypothetical protein
VRAGAFAEIDFDIEGQGRGLFFQAHEPAAELGFVGKQLVADFFIVGADLFAVDVGPFAFE